MTDASKRFAIISTHTPHAGRDRRVRGNVEFKADFNSHAPCGARLLRRRGDHVASRFQLTRPMRGATVEITAVYPIPKFQLTRPMRGATRVLRILEPGSCYFNSHAPCGARLRL